MNKVKASIAELKDHLNRDNRGQVLLDEVNRGVCDLRKSLASANDEITALKQVAEPLRKQLQQMRESVDQLRSQLAKEQSTRMQAERTVAKRDEEIVALKVEIERSYPPDIPVPECNKKWSPVSLEQMIPPDSKLDLEAFTAMFNVLRREVRVCPLGDAPRRADRSYELFELVGGFGGAEMTKLGRLVAAHAVLEFPCAVTTQFSIGKYHSKNGRTVEHERVCELFIPWFRKNVSFDVEISAGTVVCGVDQDVPLGDQHRMGRYRSRGY